MENPIFIIEFIGGLIIFFCVASMVGHFMKLDDYIRDHQLDFQKKHDGTSPKKVENFRDRG